MKAMGFGYIGFLSYAIPLWLLTGAMTLLLDIQEYELAGMSREKKLCRFVGWLNIGLGIVMFIVNWSLQRWGW